MKISPAVPVALILVCVLQSRVRAQSGVLDLTDLDNYANQPVPAYITRSNTPPDNPVTDAGATLGRVLFYDKRLSRNNTVSCSSCHRQEHAFSDPATASAGVNGTTGRHSMRLVNARFGAEPRFFWNERAQSLEAQTTQPIQDHVEMGFSGTSGDPGFPDLVAKLSAIEEYRVLFAATFGDFIINEERVQRSLAQFVRSIQSFDSKYDAGRATTPDNQNFANFTAAENRGKQIFLGPPPGGAGCAGCHRPPEFDIDPASLNNGVTNAIGGGTDLANTRSPSLRDLVNPNGLPNGGFMHTGSFTTLGAVIAHYNVIPGNNANLDPRLRRPGGVQNLNLTAQQQADLVAFLATLRGTAIYTDARWSNPFNAEGGIDFIILPASALTFTDNGDGSALLSARAAPGLLYTLQTSQDLSAWSAVETMLSDVNGSLARTIPMQGRAFYRIVYAPPSGSLSSDSALNYAAWSNGSTGGTGFGAWVLATAGSAGHFLAETASEANINTGSSKAFGLYANNGGVATASRLLSAPLGAGDAFTLRFDNNFIESGSQAGFALTDSGGAVRVRFYFVGGETTYRVTDAVTGRNTGIAWTDAGLAITFTLLSETEYSMTIGGTTVTGTMASGGSVSRFLVDNSNAGSGSDHNVYIGDLTRTDVP